jgi:hypothetical protein
VQALSFADKGNVTETPYRFLDAAETGTSLASALKLNS